MHERERALKEWLINVIPHKEFTIKPLAGDASFRRYFRIYYAGLSQVVMDAPPDKENLESFIHIAQVLAQAKVHTPELIAIDLKQGFLLLSDLGDELLLGKLNAATADFYYKQAIQTLFQIQQCSITDPLLPAFDREFMLKEMNLCPEWFLKAYLKLNLSDEENQLIANTFDWIADEVSRQPLTFIHRDFHSRNLMLPDNKTEQSIGVIDFQDAMSGPITYDLVSLLKDCYISWPKEKITDWVSLFHKNSPMVSDYPFNDFMRAFDLCGLQRHLKVLGVFCRLYLRDNKPGYLHDLPLVLKYVLECTETYKELHPLFHFLQKRVCLP